MKHLLFAFLLSGTCLFVNAQTEENQKERKFTHAVGMAAGATTGVGFSYEMGIKRYKLQITGIPVFSQNREFYSIGINNKYVLKELSSKVDLISYLAAHYLSTEDRFDSYPSPCYYDNYGNYICPPIANYNIKEEYFNVGLGGGVDIKIFPDLSFQLMVGYGLYSNNSVLTRGTVTGETAFFIKLR